MCAMQRRWNGRSLELLAPAGTFDIFREMVDAPCDAIYCGGQNLNMRMIRKGYNLTNDELREAVQLAGEREKKLIITVNSLLDPSELNEAAEYLDFLQEIQPHALIVQDLALVKMARERGVTIPLHASVMMNVHNLDMIRRLERWGISRVVLSREMGLDRVRAISEQTDMELEYFTHGDMCAVHGSQCLYSSYLYGMSSNRGRCLKPCRWPMEGGTQPFPLAVKDICLYSYLSELVLSGVSSFKIEGRMRSAEFIVPLIERYGEALDRFLDDPLASVRPSMRDMERFKKRDYSTAYAFGRPGVTNINQRGEGSGIFYSTGRMFSTPTKEPRIDFAQSSVAPPCVGAGGEGEKAHLAVKVSGLAQARCVLEYDPARIYLSTEPFAPLAPPSRTEIAELSALCRERGCELFLALPRMTGERQRELFEAWFSDHPGLKKELDGLLITHVGMVEWRAAMEMRLRCDSTMNLYNARAAAFMAEQGAEGWTPSLELPYASLLTLPKAQGREGAEKMECELLLHGVPTLMYMDHDVSDCAAGVVEMDTGESRLRIRRDVWERYHLLPETEYTLVPRIQELLAAGYRSFRLELQEYACDEAAPLMETVCHALAEPEKAAVILERLSSVRGGYSYGAQRF